MFGSFLLKIFSGVLYLAGVVLSIALLAAHNPIAAIILGGGCMFVASYLKWLAGHTVRIR